jgi:hypothetical protein
MMDMLQIAFVIVLGHDEHGCVWLDVCLQSVWCQLQRGALILEPQLLLHCCKTCMCAVVAACEGCC